MADQFNTPDSARNPEAGLAFDRWGRYKLPHAETGKVQAWTRSTTFAKSISDTFGLSMWSQRMVAKGLALRPDLLAMAQSLDVKEDKDKLNALCEDAKSAAGNKVAANWGTVLHSFTEIIDGGRGTLEDVPPANRDDVTAYVEAMRLSGLTVVPGMIERQTAVPGIDVAGTFDRLLNLDGCPPEVLRQLLGDDGPDLVANNATDTIIVGDVKSGQDLQYGWNEIAIQLLIYAMGAKTSGVYDKAAKGWEAPLPVRQDFAIVMHLPVGQKRCTLYRLDLTEAAWAINLCRDVRRWRKLRVLAEPLVMVTADGVCDPPEAAGLSWLDRFNLASSRGELSSLFNEAVADGAWSETLKAAGLARLAVLEEKAG